VEKQNPFPLAASAACAMVEALDGSPAETTAEAPGMAPAADAPVMGGRLSAYDLAKMPSGGKSLEKSSAEAEARRGESQRGSLVDMT